MDLRTAPFLSLVILLSGCAKAPVKPNTSLCRMAESNVRQRLGPEFRRVINSQLLHSDTQGTYGCGIVYQMMDEELSDELEAGPSERQLESHMVAFLSRRPGQSARFLDVKRTRGANGPVTVRLETVEVTGDGYLDLVIIERGKRQNSFVDYQGLKIINGDPAFTSEILERTLLKTAPDKTELISEWMVDNSQATPKLWIRGGHTATSYTYSKHTRRLMVDQDTSEENSAKTNPLPQNEAKSAPPTPKTGEPSAFKAEDLEPDSKDSE